MKKLNVKEIAQSYIGKSINTEKLLELFHNDGNYIARCEQFNNEKRDLFNITPALTEYWGYHGIEFWVYLIMENTQVLNCTISKVKYTGGYHGRPTVHVLSPTQQEIRVFRRIMDYITT